MAELWFYPDGSRILELSTKCKPEEAFDVAARTRAYLSEQRRQPVWRAADEDPDGARVLHRPVGLMMGARRRLRHAAGAAIRGLVLWALVALVFWAAVGLIPGIDLPSFRAALLTTALIALINALLWPLVIRVVLPLTVLSFGLGSLLY